MRTPLMFIISLLALIGLWCACMLCGAVEIPASDVWSVCLGGGSGGGEAERMIILESRLPMAVTALLAGMSLSVSGLLMQTTFQNPLAGPSILGVSTGASLGVALLMLGPAAWSTSLLGADGATQAATLLGALVGAGIIVLILSAFSSMVKSAVMLLIVGIMIGYMASAVVSWLNFFAAAESVKGFTLWGMGSFMGVTRSQLPLFALITLLLTGLACTQGKPLNVLLLGDRYAASLGYNPRATRTWLLLLAGALAAVATAYCGPIGFIGLAVPHIARILFATSHHGILLPATALLGAVVGLLCAWICVYPSAFGILPLSAVTPIIGAPVVLYVILRRRSLHYFN